MIVSGNAPPIFCGIGDYSQQLAKALQDEKIETVHIGLEREQTISALKPWRIIFKILKVLRHKKFDLVHIQYEAFSFSQSTLFVLFLSALPIPLIVTFHEVFQRTALERFRDRFLAKRAAKIIVTDLGRQKI